MNISALQPHIKASELPLEQLAGNKNITEREKVGEVARQFESVLLRQILQESRKSVAGATSDSSKTSSGIYDDMVNSQLADSISRSGAFGLAKSLQGQLTHQVLPNAAAGPPLLTPLAAPTVRHNTK